jgi:quinol monooxygenase YgiN
MEHLILLSGGIIFGLWLSALFPSHPFNGTPSSLTAKRETSVKSAFVLLVAIDFASEGDKDSFKKLFKNIAQYVAEYEFSTLSYELAESDKSSTRVIIIERYKDKDAYTNIHRSSEPFKKFRSILQGYDVKIDGHSYIESNIGFI